MRRYSEAEGMERGGVTCVPRYEMLGSHGPQALGCMTCLVRSVGNKRDVGRRRSGLKGVGGLLWIWGED